MGHSVQELNTEEGEHSIIFDLYSKLDGRVGMVEGVEKVPSCRQIGHHEECDANIFMSSI